jgi:hypothetical protein
MVAASDDETEGQQETEATQDPQPQSSDESQGAEQKQDEVQFDDSPRGRLAKAQHERKLRKAETVKTGGTKMADLNLADLSLSDEDRAAVEAAIRERDEEINNLKGENKTLQASDHERQVDAEIEELKSIGLSEENGAGGLLKFIRRVKLSDDGQPAGILASDDENKEEEQITLSGALDKFIELLPRNQEGRLDLGDQAVAGEAGDPPPATTEGENNSPEDDLKVAYEALGVERAEFKGGDR